MDRKAVHLPPLHPPFRAQSQIGGPRRLVATPLSKTLARTFFKAREKRIAPSQQQGFPLPLLETRFFPPPPPTLSRYK